MENDSLDNLNPQEMLDRAKGSIEVLNEYRDPTPIGQTEQNSSSSFIYKSFIVSTFVAVVIIAALYIRYKMSE